MAQRKTIITIGREFGSGGREIGEKLAKELGIPFYDKQIISLAAKKSGISEELFAENEDKVTSSFLYSIATGMYFMGSHVSPVSEMPLSDKLFFVQSDIIKEVAQKGSCVIVGRCADYVLKEVPNCFHVFIYAPMDFRKKRAVEKYGVDAKFCEDTLRKADKKRASFYNYYSSQKWGRTGNYDICLSSAIGIEQSVALLKSFVELAPDKPGVKE